MTNSVFNRRAARWSKKRPLFVHVCLNRGDALAVPDDPSRSSILPYIKNIVERAGEHGGIDFVIGLDMKTLDPVSCFWVHAYAYVCAKSPAHLNNLTFFDLRKIPSYEGLPSYMHEPVFNQLASSTEQREALGSVYSRADYARVLMLYHAMKTNPDRRYIVYTDSDLRKFSWSRMQRSLDSYGICLHNAGVCGVSNGLMALNMSFGRVRRFFPWLLRATHRHAKAGLCGYKPFEVYLEKVLPQHGQKYPDTRHFYLPPVGRSMRVDPLLRDLRIR